MVTSGKATRRVHFAGRSSHDVTTAFRDKGQCSLFLLSLFPSHHPYKDKVSGAFFNLLYFNWWEKVVPLVGALSWMDLIRSNDQINGEFRVRTFGDWVVWRGLCCYISLHLSLWWEEKQSTSKSQTWVLLHRRGRREDLGLLRDRGGSGHLGFGVSWLSNPYFWSSLLPSSLVSRAFISGWPWSLCHIWGEPQAPPRMGKELVHLSSFLGADAEDSLSPFDKSPLSRTSKMVLNILGLSLWAGSVTDFSPLTDHLSGLVGYSSPKNPEGKVLGRGGVGVWVERNTGNTGSQQVFQLQLFPKVGEAQSVLEKGQSKV